MFLMVFIIFDNGSGKKLIDDILLEKRIENEDDVGSFKEDIIEDDDM